MGWAMADHFFHTDVLALNGPGFTALGTLLGVLALVLGALWGAAHSDRIGRFRSARLSDFP